MHRIIQLAISLNLLVC